MIEVTINTFINTLIDAISSSPTTFVTLIAGIIFLIAMLISLKKHKKMGKTLFIIGWLFIILFIIFRYSNHLTTLFDNFMNNVFMQIFFPNLATYVIIIAITNFIFLFTILKGNSKTSNKVINSLFFTIIMLLLILVLDVIIKNEINIYERLTVYSNQTLLILIEATTITFVLWLIILGSKAIVSKLINKSDKKIKAKYNKQEKINTLESEKAEVSNIPNSPSLNNTENLIPINNEYIDTAIPKISNLNTIEPPTEHQTFETSILNISGNSNVESMENQSTNEINTHVIEEATENKIESLNLNKPENLNINNQDSVQPLNTNDSEQIPNSSNINETDTLNIVDQAAENSSGIETLNLEESEILNLNNNSLKQDDTEVLKL